MSMKIARQCPLVAGLGRSPTAKPRLALTDPSGSSGIRLVNGRMAEKQSFAPADGELFPDVSGQC
ncbi:hypothetical protein D9M68_100100 [compost metagenome]